MANIKRYYQPFLYIGAIALLFNLFSLTALAQEPDFSRTGRPSRSGDAGSRGGCPMTERSLTALVPTSAGGGWTTQPHPTVWVYIPYSLTADDAVRFSVRDDQDNDIYHTQIAGDRIASGVVSFAPPTTTTPPLEVGKRYTWYLSIYCGQLPDLPAVASGWIQRVELNPAVSNQIQQASPPQRSSLYATNLVWYDALTILAEERRTHRGDRALTTSWSNLLQLPSVGLNDFVTDPLTPCCTLNP